MLPFLTLLTTPHRVRGQPRTARSRAASLPEQLVAQAAALELPALAVCDRDGVYGIPRAHGAGKKANVRAIVATELTLDDGSVLPVLVATRVGYQNLCRLLTKAKLRGTKHKAPVAWSELDEFAHGLVALTCDEEGPVRRALAVGDSANAASIVERLRTSLSPRIFTSKSSGISGAERQE